VPAVDAGSTIDSKVEVAEGRGTEARWASKASRPTKLPERLERGQQGSGGGW
jgi:hypothetical protein